MSEETSSLKRILILSIIVVFYACSLSGQKYLKITNPAYKYYAKPGFVNITEITRASGLNYTNAENTFNYFGITNVFGYQIDRNFFTGIGVGYYVYDREKFVPVLLEYRYNAYLERLSPFIYADGGTLLDPADIFKTSRIFINPGFGISRSVSYRLEGMISMGIMIQAGSTSADAVYINYKLGLIFRKNSYRLFNPEF